MGWKTFSEPVDHLQPTHASGRPPPKISTAPKPQDGNIHAKPWRGWELFFARASLKSLNTSFRAKQIVLFTDPHHSCPPPPRCQGPTTPGVPWKAAASGRHFSYTPSPLHTHSHTALRTLHRPLGPERWTRVSGLFPPNLSYFDSKYPVTSLKGKRIIMEKQNYFPQITWLPCPRPHE